MARLADMQWMIWSHQHGAWWGPNRLGYQTSITGCGLYSAEDAREICSRAIYGWDGEGNPPEVAVRWPGFNGFTDDPILADTMRELVEIETETIRWAYTAGKRGAEMQYGHG